MRLQDFMNYSNSMEHNDEHIEQLKRHKEEIDAEHNEKVSRSTKDEILSLIDSDDETDKKTGQQLLDREVERLKRHNAPSSGDIARSRVESYMASKQSKKRVQKLANTQLDN